MHDPTQTEVACIAAAVTVVFDLARFWFLLSLRFGSVRSPIPIRILDRVIGSFVWRCFMILAIMQVLPLWDAVSHRLGEHRDAVVAVLTVVYFAVFDRILGSKLDKWSSDPDSEFRSTLRRLASVPLRVDRDAWVGLEQYIRLRLFERTADIRSRSSDVVNELFAQKGELIQTHVRRSRMWVFRILGYPQYESGPWVQALRPGDPKRLELLLNAMGFPAFEGSARNASGWNNSSRREFERTLVSWPTSITTPCGTFSGELTDVSGGGACVRLEQSTSCEGAQVVAGSGVHVHVMGRVAPMQVRWTREQSFGGAFSPY